MIDAAAQSVPAFDWEAWYAAAGGRRHAIPEVAATFQSTDPAVASVGASGVATGHKAGAATIKVQLAGATAEASLLVN